ncbi:3-carboxy-cis,cis-muconate cycloisomerase [Saccharopolyspora rhizosphaerae]|uniref:3-carboxy-cis,cis-muconate cycloisomerase n=1 Tax=Saccharopolyspora rhizosphaerae TaxID=2492662 RepID=A0A3R8QGC9_9PSEU|nr:3-carboxy-cis,cis-muconate cycloisomerase [Saccharopolyspora rhizosphaerae]RRO20390.1 3-carboxy-cis,cis-muconate cycloisomerase [Saccharopolyspora rhizosphaerae]
MFGPMFSTPDATARTSDGAWLQAMLDFESALAAAQAEAGIVPVSAAEAIAAHCRAELFDTASIGERAVSSATPVIALVRDLTALVGEDARAHVHRGATSQDVVDTAAMLVVRDVLELVVTDLRAAAQECARLAEEHRGTVLIARSLLQQALPTTFGLRCAGWLTALDESIEGLTRFSPAVQFGGAAGTLASLGTGGPEVLAGVAERLGLAEPVLPWHTDRTRIAELAGALGTASGVLGKIALDVELHAQTEVGELTEGAPGGSSAMPHKQNPATSVLITAATQRVPGLVATLLAAMPQAYERAAGAWQSEWEPLTELLRLTAAAARRTRELLEGLRVHPDRMAANLDLTRGLVLAENAAGRLMTALGRTEAQDLVTELCRRTVERGSTLRDELLAEPRVREVLSEQDVLDATSASDYLGAAGGFIDRALATHTGLEKR